MRFLNIGGIKRLAGFMPIAFGLFVLLFIGSTKPALASTGINQQISFTGKIVQSDGTNITNGTYNMEFKIYQDGNSSGVGSTLKWTEDWLVGGAGGITLSNGTFQVNLGAGTDSSNLDTAVDWNQGTLWLSMQIGNSSACTISTTFQSNCGGDGEMTPYIRLTAVPQAINAEKLGGLSSSSFGQLGSANSWSNTNTFQPATNVSSLVVKQNSNSSPTADILNVQTQNGTSIIQVTGPSLDNAAVTINSVGGSNGLTLDAANGTILLGSNTTTLQKSATTFAFDLTSASDSTLAISNSGAGNIILKLDSGGVFAVGTATGVSVGCSSGQYLDNATVTGGIITGGTCTTAGGGSGYTYITKAADQTANQSSTALQNDNTLFFSASANSVYMIQAWIPVDDSNTGADLKYAWNVPAGSTVSIFNQTYSSATASITCNALTATATCSTTIDNAANFINVNGTVRTSSTSGNIQFQFSQNTSTAASFPVVKAGATLAYFKSL